MLTLIADPKTFDLIGVEGPTSEAFPKLAALVALHKVTIAAREAGFPDTRRLAALAEAADRSGYGLRFRMPDEPEGAELAPGVRLKAE